jgi:hypothetical protein
VFFFKADLEEDVSVGSGCNVGAGVRVDRGAQLDDTLVVFRNGLNGEQGTSHAMDAIEVYLLLWQMKHSLQNYCVCY